MQITQSNSYLPGFSYFSGVIEECARARACACVLPGVSAIVIEVVGVGVAKATR